MLAAVTARGRTGISRYAFIKRFAISGWLILFAITLMLLLYPVGVSKIRFFMLVSVPLLSLSGASILLMYGKNRLALLCFSVIFAVAFFLVMPGRAYSVERLKKSYLTCLEAYEGTAYEWGGENFIGIDCSGLVRKGLINANIRTGILTLNPELLRNAFHIWWNDCTAKSLKEEYKCLTSFLFKAPDINSITGTEILPGDIAVTSDGVHVLAYLGQGTWIQADPCFDKVIKVKAPSGNPWFSVPVDILRWRQLK